MGAVQTQSPSLETLKEDLGCHTGLAQQHEGKPLPAPLSEPLGIVPEVQQAFEPQQFGK